MDSPNQIHLLGSSALSGGAADQGAYAPARHCDVVLIAAGGSPRNASAGFRLRIEKFPYDKSSREGASDVNRRTYDCES
jgi:hypothetical protein